MPGTILTQDTISRVVPGGPAGIILASPNLEPTSGNSQLRAELLRYSKLLGYSAHHFADSDCQCGSRRFRLCIDDTEGVAVRLCAACSEEHPIGDSDEYLADAEPGECECPCGGNLFEVSVGVSLYEGSEDVRWIYVGGRCPACGLAACYGDWKIGGGAYRVLLDRV